LKKPVLILGVGNEILTDDGIGPKIVHRLAEECPQDNCDYQTAGLGGLELVELIQGYKKVVFIDAIKTGRGPIGDVYFFTPRDFRETLHLSNIHDISFLQALELARQMKIDIPEDIRIIAIEIKEDKIFGEAFTPEVQNRYEEIYQVVKKNIQAMELNNNK
jgi:hydrogenase maturation protease